MVEVTFNDFWHCLERKLHAVHLNQCYLLSMECLLGGRVQLEGMMGDGPEVWQNFGFYLLFIKGF